MFTEDVVRVVHSKGDRKDSVDEEAYGTNPFRRRYVL